MTGIKQPLTSFVVALCLVAVATNFNSVSSADLSTIVINADETVEPSTSPISHSGKTYTLTRDLMGCHINIQCKNITFDGANHTLSDAPDMGIYVNSDYVIVRNLNITGCGQGAIYVNGTHNVIENITCTSNLVGIIVHGDYNNIIRNTLSSGLYPIIYIYSNGNTISQNYMYGIHLEGVDNIITETMIFNIGISSSGRNIFYLNNFQVHQYFGIDSGTNCYDYNGLGNYWSNYNGTDSNGDGIGDIPYQGVKNLKDSYPLMEPYNATNPKLIPQTTASTSATLQGKTNLDLEIILTILATIIILCSILFMAKHKKFRKISVQR